MSKELDDLRGQMAENRKTRQFYHDNATEALRRERELDEDHALMCSRLKVLEMRERRNEGVLAAQIARGG